MDCAYPACGCTLADIQEGGACGRGAIGAKRRSEVPPPTAMQLAMIEQRLTNLEKTPLRYEGIWDKDKCYSKGAFVTHNGALWHCGWVQVTHAMPGTSEAWTLAVRKGRDARDRR
jgi:hypothetical protein